MLDILDTSFIDCVHIYSELFHNANSPGNANQGMRMGFKVQMSVLRRKNSGIQWILKIYRSAKVL